MEGYFEKEFVLTPDYCDARAGLSPYGAFTIFQAIATEHAERIGVGGAAMAKRGEFWLTVHSRVDFVGRAHLMQTLRAKTWPEPCDETSIRCFRSYSLNCGDTPVALGRTQWAILGPEQKVVPFGQSGFPRDFPFTGEAGITAAPVRFRDDFAPEDFVRTYTVRPPETLSQVIFHTPTTPDLFFHAVCAALGTGQRDRSRPLAVSIFSVMPIISLPACTPKPL